MGRFNASATTTTTLTTNLAGGEAYETDARYELAAILLTSFVKDQHYRSADDTMKRVNELVKQVPYTFAAKAALYARNEFGMRSITHVTAGEIAKHVKGEAWTRRFLANVFRRPDDMMETFSYYTSKYGKRPIPNSLKKGIRDALAKFDAYQLAKYRAEGKATKLVDLVNLVHPTPGKNGGKLKKGEGAVGKLVAGTLKSTNTWETKISAAGNAETKEEQEEIKRAAWATLLREKKLGYLALLRNLRNIVEQAPDVLPLALEQLVDTALIAKSLVFPFQYLPALAAVQELGTRSGVRETVIALSKALDLSLVNVPQFEGRTLIALDDSGSMGTPSDPKSAWSIGSLFAAALYKTNDSTLMMFSDRARFHQILPTNSIAGIVREMSQHRTGCGTNFNCVFDSTTDKFDRVVILSDMQAWMHGGYSSAIPKLALSGYRRRTGANPKIYSFDLAGYGTLMFPEKNVFCLAGVSDKAFDVMKTLELDRQALIKRIEAVEL